MISIRKCLICMRVKKENLVLMGQNICHNCEKDIVKSRVQDREYPLYQRGVKEILGCLQKS